MALRALSRGAPIDIISRHALMG
ncbi:hypothetical protein KL86PLE_90334 [uncultured Pleomorphomonas sp.]|uniref:Uncharacterized protein n=1 Tax=uncultured Pleomorphomonas sp. TaxID=442121 RepID=A0A212LP19_9HYPH|nr:hypothetical protein KL86PLE_90334 [uncultured Pleomorphomonas sp.]